MHPSGRWSAQVALDDGGSWLLVEDEAARVMPSSAAVRAAGRFDLHHAILFAGGYSQVGTHARNTTLHAWIGPPSRVRF